MTQLSQQVGCELLLGNLAGGVGIYLLSPSVLLCLSPTFLIFVFTPSSSDSSHSFIFLWIALRAWKENGCHNNSAYCAYGEPATVHIVLTESLGGRMRAEVKPEGSWGWRKAVKASHCVLGMLAEKTMPSLKRQRLPGQGTGEAFRRMMRLGTDFDQGHLCTSLSFQYRRKLNDFMKLVAGYALLVSENTSSGFSLLPVGGKSFSCREGRALGSGALKKPGQLFQSHSVPAAKETCSKHGFSGSRITKGSEVILKTWQRTAVMSKVCAGEAVLLGEHTLTCASRGGHSAHRTLGRIRDLATWPGLKGTEIL